MISDVTAAAGYHAIVNEHERKGGKDKAEAEDGAEDGPATGARAAHVRAGR